MSGFISLDADICITFTADRNVMKVSKIKTLGNFIFLCTPNLEIYRMFKKELYSSILNVAVWRVLRERLHLKAYKLSIAQHVERL
jgi:hypothetical protein